MKYFRVITSFFALLLLSKVSAQEIQWHVTVRETPDSSNLKSLEGTLSEKDLKLSAINSKEHFPELAVPVPKGFKTRFVAAKLEGEKLAVVLQWDEFFLQYEEFQLENNAWKRNKKLEVCKLYGTTVERLAEVEITKFGQIEVRYSEKPVQLGPVSKRHEELILKKYHRKDNDQVRKYAIGIDGNFSLSVDDKAKTK